MDNGQERTVEIHNKINKKEVLVMQNKTILSVCIQKVNWEINSKHKFISNVYLPFKLSDIALNMVNILMKKQTHVNYDLHLAANDSSNYSGLNR